MNNLLKIKNFFPYYIKLKNKNGDLLLKIDKLLKVRIGDYKRYAILVGVEKCTTTKQRQKIHCN